MGITVGAFGGTGTLVGEWTMDGPPPLLLQSTGDTHFPDTRTPFLLPRLIVVPSIWSLLLLGLSWKTHSGSVTRTVRDGQTCERDDEQRLKHSDPVQTKEI